MTMPHLMNCGHSPDSWCLDCVREMHDELTARAEDAEDEATRMVNEIEQLRAIVRRVGSVVGEARRFRERGMHHLAVYGAIGKCLIDMTEWDGFAEANEAAEAAEGGEG